MNNSSGSKNKVHIIHDEIITLLPQFPFRKT
jgi:hypothetical protein